MNADPGAAPALRAQATYRRRPGFVLELTLALPRGVTVLLGPSGAGKSTTLDILAGHLLPDSGSIELDGKPLLLRNAGKPASINVPPQRRRIGYIMQAPALFPHLDVRANLAYGLAGCSHKLREERIAELTAALGLADLLRRWPDTLSGGERQRVALGRALAPWPRALLLDEPLSAVDLAQRDTLLRSLSELLNAVDIPVLYVTHSAEEQHFFAAQRCPTLGLFARADGQTVELVSGAAV